MARVVGATSHGNRHALVNVNYNMKVVVDFLVEKKPFEKNQGRGFGENSETKHANLFSNGLTKIALGVPLKNYQI